MYLFETGPKQVLDEIEPRAWDLYLAWAAQRGKENFDALPLKHGHLILYNGCSHSEYVFSPILTVTKVWNTGETGDINRQSSVKNTY